MHDIDDKSVTTFEVTVLLFGSLRVKTGKWLQFLDVSKRQS